jgi:hypothetical protein
VTEDTSSSVPIYLCCAEDSEVFLVKVVDALHKEGMAPEVISGVEVDSALLGDLVDRTDAAALFVLCQSDALDKAATRRLTGLFSARKGPCQKIITVQLYESRPLSVLPGIRSGVKEVLRARAEAKQSSGERVNLREVVGPVAVSAVRPSTAKPSIPRDDQLPDLDGIDDAEALARELHEEMVAAEAILERRGNRREGSRRPKPVVQVEKLDLPDIEPPRAEAKPTADLGPRAPSKPKEAPASPASDETREPGAPAALLDSQALAAVPMDALDDSTDDDIGDTSPGKEAGEITGPHASTSAAVERPRRSPVGLLVAVGGACALGVIAFSVLQRDEGDGERPASETTRPATDVTARPSEPRASPETATKAKAAEAAHADHDEEDDDDDDDDDGDAVDPSDGVPARGRTVPPPPPKVDADTAAVNAAIADGRMRSLDTILMLAPSGETMTWEAARDHCRAQRVAGLGEWRMPSKAEVTRLRRARLLPGASYWTRQKGDVPDEAVAWDARSGRWVVWLTIEPNARALCVRKR